MKCFTHWDAITLGHIEPKNIEEKHHRKYFCAHGEMHSRHRPNEITQLMEGKKKRREKVRLRAKMKM